MGVSLSRETRSLGGAVLMGVRCARGRGSLGSWDDIDENEGALMAVRTFKGLRAGIEGDGGGICVFHIDC